MPDTLKGWISNDEVQDDENKKYLKNPLILISDKIISTINELLPLLEIQKSAEKPLLIISSDLNGDALANIRKNNAFGKQKVAAIRLKLNPKGNSHLVLLDHIALLTGGAVLSETRGLTLENIQLVFLGQAERVCLEKDMLYIIGGMGNKSEIQARAKQVEPDYEGDLDFNLIELSILLENGVIGEVETLFIGQ